MGWTEIPKPEALKTWWRMVSMWNASGSYRSTKDFVPATKAHPAFHVQNLDLLKDHLSSKQVHIIDDDARTDEGVKRFYVHDPFGNRMEFWNGLNKMRQRSYPAE